MICNICKKELFLGPSLRANIGDFILESADFGCYRYFENCKNKECPGPGEKVNIDYPA